MATLGVASDDLAFGWDNEFQTSRVLVPAFRVAAVIHEPGGAHPSPVQGYYNRDHLLFQEYHQSSRRRDAFLQWLEAWVLGAEGRSAYLKQLGADHWKQLQRKISRPAAPVDHGY